MIGKDGLAARVIEAGGKLTVRSALNPILWLCAIITIPGLLAVSLLTTPPIWLTWMICAPVGAAIFGFLFLLFFDRDKLQSENYQLKKRSLELIEQKGDAGPMVIDADKVEAVSENEILLLSDEMEGSK